METEKCVMALAALAHATRQQAFRTLVRYEPAGLAAGELADALEVPQNTLSAHLSVLSRADLVSSERRGRSIVYRANLAAFGDLTTFLLKDCCAGHPEACAPVAKTLKACLSKKKERSRA